MVADEFAALQAAEAVIVAARLIERGCDCEYDHRCSNCSRIVDLRYKLQLLDEARSKLR
jgi:hypothetical protein